MTLLAPFALWGLLALAVPLLLHLRRRRVGRTIQVGSLKHLETLPTAERRGPRVRDPLRLLLRLAILGLVILVLAEPQWPGRLGRERGVVLADSGATPVQRDSLAALGELIIADLSTPWDAIARIDDSLPEGTPLSIASTTASDRFTGARPRVRREVVWVQELLSGPPTRVADAPLSGSTVAQHRALDAAVAATIATLGDPGDTAGWQARLPRWWRDSLDATSFPVAVARALAPGRAFPAATRLDLEQILPTELGVHAGRTRMIDLHWWIWGGALMLFLFERLWAWRLEEIR